MIYTKREREDRVYTLQDAVTFARRRYAGPLCMNGLRGAPLDTQVTLELANWYADQIVRDSEWHAS